jgi:hypothetical protein
VVDALADRNVANAARSRTTRIRDKTQVVTYRVPHNAAIQIYDYKQKRSRYACLLSFACASRFMWVYVCVCVCGWVRVCT